MACATSTRTPAPTPARSPHALAPPAAFTPPAAFAPPAAFTHAPPGASPSPRSPVSAARTAPAPAALATSSPLVSASKSTKFEAWYACKTRCCHAALPWLFAKSARKTPTVASANLNSPTPARCKACVIRPITSASAAAPCSPMHSTPICVISRVTACKRVSA